MADYCGDGLIKSMNIDLFGGQYVAVDGGLGWLGACFNPVVDNYQISSTVFLTNVTVPYWIMSPDAGPASSDEVRPDSPFFRQRKADRRAATLGLFYWARGRGHDFAQKVSWLRIEMPVFYRSIL